MPAEELPTPPLSRRTRLGRKKRLNRTEAAGTCKVGNVNMGDEMRRLNQGLILGLGTMLAASSAWADLSNREVKGTLQEFSESRITVADTAGVSHSCARDNATIIEGSPVLNDRVELKLSIDLAHCDKLDKETPEGSNSGEGQGKNKSKRVKAKFEALNPPAPGKKQKEGGSIELKSRDGASPRIEFKIEAKAYVASSTSSSSWRFGGLECPLAKKGERVGHEHSSNSSSSPSRLAQLSASIKQSGAAIQSKPAGCQITSDALKLGGIIEVVVDNAARLRATLPPVPTAAATPPPTP